MQIKHKRNITFHLFGFIVLNSCYFLMNYAATGKWHLDDHYLKLMILMNFIWAFLSWWKKKYDFARYKTFRDGLYVLAKTTLFMLYLTLLFIVLLWLTGFSRLHVFGTFTLLFIFDCLLLLGVRSRFGLSFSGEGKEGKKHFVINFSISLAVVDYLIFLLAIYLVNYFKYHDFILEGNGWQIFLYLTGLWLLTSGWTGKFRERFKKNIYYSLSPFIKAAALMALTMALLVFTFGLFHYSRFYIFGTILLFISLEIPFYILFSMYRSGKQKQRDIESREEVLDIFRQEKLEPVRKKIAEIKEPVQSKLKDIYLHDNAGLLHLIEKNVDTQNIDAGAAQVLNTHTFYNIRILENSSLDLFINLHRVNDFRRINEYFLEVYKKIINSGYFIGCKSTMGSHREQIFARYPDYIAHFVYFVNFIFHRVFPKIPFLQKIYFVLSRGRNKILSKAELLGRLHFCGFKIIAFKTINNFLYFIAQKTKTSSLDLNPSYSPVINLKRVGYKGQIIYIKKLRTMHPYSEYLQDYVFEKNHLAENGKFNDDFRVTEWGKLFRKLWIDEIPQLLNFVRGDIGLIGVRALSEHYLSLYPADLQELRLQFKPGLIPPYYADMPNSFDEIVASERRYLENKQAHPFRTDLIYFFKVWNNILFKKARSQ